MDESLSTYFFEYTKSKRADIESIDELALFTEPFATLTLIVFRKQLMMKVAFSISNYVFTISRRKRLRRKISHIMSICNRKLEICYENLNIHYIQRIIS